jgi:seryl-tRNA(Sec) selenium transferase
MMSKIKRWLRVESFRLLALLRGVNLFKMSHKELEQRVTCAEIRTDFKALGFILPDISDKELTDRLQQTAVAFASSGISTEDLQVNINNLRHALKGDGRERGV